MPFRKIAWAILIVAGLAWVSGLLLNRFAASPPPSAVGPASPGISSQETAEAASIMAKRPGAASSVKLAPTPAAPATPATWEEARDEVLKSGESATNKAEILLAWLPRLSGDNQAEAARHLVNLLGDDHFVTAGNYLTNAQAPEAVQRLLMADLLNRPDHVKLPLFLAIARSQGHPRAEEARNLLVALMPEDLNTNWEAWETAIQARLKP
jgi:hypothetical protein